MHSGVGDEVGTTTADGGLVGVSVGIGTALVAEFGGAIFPGYPEGIPTLEEVVVLGGGPKSAALADRVASTTITRALNSIYFYLF